MALSSLKSQLSQYSIDYSIKDINNVTRNYQVNINNHWSQSTTGRKGELFNVGGGSYHNSYPVNNFGFGSYVFTPKQNFVGLVHVWGAGGGAHHNSGGRFAGGGGYAQAWIDFVKEVPYTFVIGEAGNFDNQTSHGGGGRGHSSGGSGGGLSGIFFNTDITGTSRWNGTPPVTRANALVISGGGGGGGHHNEGSHTGSGGGGGGWSGKNSHNAGGGSQTGGGGQGYGNAQAGFELHGGHSGTNSSWLGGGGGGWFGGGGGGHTSNHHDGGAGGSGHIAYDSSIATQPNNDKARYLLNGFFEKAPGSRHFNDPRPANFVNPLNITEGRHAGMGGHGELENNHGPTWGQRHGKIILTLLPSYFQQYKFPTHSGPNSQTGWSQTF